MPEAFDNQAFEHLMGEAVEMHGQKRYEDACNLTRQAYEMAPLNSFEKGRAARDTAANHDKLGHTNEAKDWAGRAYAIHDALVENMEQPTREAWRERSVSTMYLGLIGLRKVIAAREVGNQLENPDALDLMRQTWSDLKAAKLQATGINRRVDQYEVNAARRVSIAESLQGDKEVGFKIGVRAVGLAFWSESPRLDTANRNLPRKGRINAKRRALIGGVAALGVNLLSIPKCSKSQQIANRIANKVL